MYLTLSSESLSGYRTASNLSCFKWQWVDPDRPFKVFADKLRSNKRWLRKRPFRRFDCTRTRDVCEISHSLSLFLVFLTLLSPLRTYVFIAVYLTHCSSVYPRALDFHVWSTCGLRLNVSRAGKYIDQAIRLVNTHVHGRKISQKHV